MATQLIPNGSTVTYTGKWPPGRVGSVNDNAADSVISRVGETLVRKFGLIVRSQHSDQTVFSQFSGLPFQVTLELGVQNGLGYAKPDDLINCVRNAVYETLGAFPSSDSLPYVQPPSGAKAPTGQPGVTPVGEGCIAGTSNNLGGGFSIGCWFNNLTQKGLASFGFLSLIAVAGIGIAVYFGFRPRSHE